MCVGGLVSFKSLSRGRVKGGSSLSHVWLSVADSRVVMLGLKCNQCVVHVAPPVPAHRRWAPLQRRHVTLHEVRRPSQFGNDKVFRRAGNQLIMVQCRQPETVDVILDLNGERTGSGGAPKAPVMPAPAPQPPPSQPTPQPPPSPAKPTLQPPPSPAKPTLQHPPSPAKPTPQPPPSPAKPAPKPPPVHTEPWACSACTLINGPHRSTCSACETAAPPPPSIDQPVAPKPAISYYRPSEKVKHFRGPYADYCKPLAPCYCVSADGEAIFGCVPTDRSYFLPACLHMALCPQLGCDPRGGDEDNNWDYCCRPFFITLLVTPYVCCLQGNIDAGGLLCGW